MCDTLAAVGDGRLLFAKNSDRPPREAQVVESLAARGADPRRRLRTQYLDVGPDPGAHAIVGSRPTWLWGLEHGVNERGVAIGNAKIWTVDDPRGRPAALLGMDLVRLALERAGDADEAVAVITGLLEAYGQGGSGEAEHDEPYHSAFLVADRGGAFVLETSDRTWAARRLDAGGVAISNRVSLSHDWTAASADVPAGSDFQRWRQPRVPTTIADHRLAATTACVTGVPSSALDARPVAATLRDHGHGPLGAPGDTDASQARAALPTGDEPDRRGVTVCMHVRGHQATTASTIVEVAADPDAPARVWVALGSPCASVYVPGFAPLVAPELASAHEWARFAALRDRVERDAGALATVRVRLASVEAELWAQADAVHAADGDRAAFVRTAYRSVDQALRDLAV